MLVSVGVAHSSYSSCNLKQIIWSNSSVRVEVIQGENVVTIVYNLLLRSIQSTLNAEQCHQ